MKEQQQEQELVNDFKQAMRRLTSTISLITTRHLGQPFGMAATAVQSVTADPATILVCVNRSASISTALEVSGRFAVNMLHLSHVDLVPIFSGQLKGHERFEHGQWVEQHGVPVLADAQAALVCEVCEVATIGSHDVIFGRVLWVDTRPDISPLLYEDGRFARSAAIK
ncbi:MULTISPECIES: flavin reductase family protein [unclassified Pseudomonas]|uniref:flavin reductase family protein n=1 Tax=unclassified Pseudomonas TaxID=196821 RepID=UPI000C86B2F7|nr:MULTISPECIES: flavin reductase family protein [unclassified Pseudomonas]PMV22704.1 flavin reductase [Pseudomonas sp. FW305-3-2-15-C-TSA2]PMV29367.1 flavin reductase [Pseudomonas sp. DP16D-L5]PMV39270.1 flavin reductase [Pseudomonas sp. FW305-3-2-15-A-LB2]PMV45580.1 flavin reductase [Pseudomonas sp. FW305-3-2-15-C-R2A1]PMV51977.1 flavin reductase [Pseudomonas sp. FW305-3-2-15-C-LB1]